MSEARELDVAPRAAGAPRRLGRFARVLGYIDAHLEDALPIEALSRVAGLSRFHFQRQFAGQLGITAHRYVQLVRLRRAAFQLAFRRRRIIEVATEAGYRSHEAFSRAFRAVVRQAPSAFRAHPDWPRWRAAERPLAAIRASGAPALRAEDVRVVAFPATRIVAMEHRGDPAQLFVTLGRFIAWRRGAGLTPATSATFNVVYDDPARVAPAAFRFDIGVATDRAVEDARLGLVAKVLPAGRCATVRHVGPDEALWRTVAAVAAIAAAHGHAPPPCAEAPPARPLYLRRVRLFPEVAEHEAVTDVFVPLDPPAARVR